jgi:fatty acid desaturase
MAHDTLRPGTTPEAASVRGKPTGGARDDAGHRQIFASKRANDLVGRLHGGLLIGPQPAGREHPGTAEPHPYVAEGATGRRRAAGGAHGNEKVDYLRRQVLTSRNVRGGRLTDLVLGGLNYQIEHHLFPSMPRPSLRRAQALVRAYCEQHGISYAETSLARSYTEVIRHLHAVGVTASRRIPSNPADGMGVA